MLSLTNTEKLTREPFKTLFLSQLEASQVETLADKTEFIQHLVDTLEALEISAENNKTVLHWTSVFTGFSCAATIAGVSVLNPVLGGLLGIVSAASAVGTIGLTVHQNHAQASILDTFKRCKIALDSDEAIRWASIWHLSGSTAFMAAVKAAMQGVLNADENQIVRVGRDNRTPLTVAVDYVARRYGTSREQILAELSKIKLGNVSNLPKLEQASEIQDKPVYSTTPTVLQPDTPTVLQSPNVAFDPRANALNTLQALVDKANQSVKGGCIIFAAPGAGKTTFLGVAWGRLKAQYGANFKSLVVVVKKSDVNAFRGVSDACVCVKDGVIDAAIRIIRFIDNAMLASDNVSRLFLDDFLTMQKYFETISTTFINPDNYTLYGDRKEALKANDRDACLLSKLLNSRLNEAWLVGRQPNFSLYVSSHSSNVEALPFIGSREARAVGDFIFLARNDKRDFIEQALINPNLIADNAKRATLKAQLNSLNVSSDEPIMLSNFNNWVLGVVPSSVSEEYKQFRAIWEPLGANPNVKSLEALFNADSAKDFEIVEDTTRAEEVIEEVTEITVTDAQANILFGTYSKDSILNKLFATSEATLGKFIKNELKITKGDKYKEAKSAIEGYLKQQCLTSLIEKLNIDYDD